MARRGMGLCAGLLLLLLVVMVGPTVAQADTGSLPPGGSFHALTSTRILDTRIGLGAAKGATRSVTVRTAGVAGIPSSNVSAVAVNLTVMAPSGGGFLTAYAAGTTRPNVFSSNYAAGQTVSAMTAVQVSSTGQFVLYSAAQAQLIADVVGYFTTPQTATTSGLLKSVRPARLMDTSRSFGGKAPGPGGTTTLQVTGAGGVPTTGVSAVVLNVTITAATAGGYVTPYPAGTARPPTPTVNFVRGESRANRTIVRIGTNGRVSFFNAAGTTQLLIDVTGYFTDATSTAGGSYFMPIAPKRLIDSRTTSSPKWTSAGTTHPIPITIDTGPAASAPSVMSVTPTTAAALTLTSLNPSSVGYLTAYPAGSSRPGTSDVNVRPATTTSNSTLAGVGTKGEVNLFSSTAGNIVVDVTGYFVQAPATPTPPGMWDTWDQASVPATAPVLPAVRTNTIHGVSSIIEFRSGASFAVRPDGTVVGWTAPFPPFESSPDHPLDSSGSVHTVAGLTDITALAASGIVSGTGYALRSDGSVWSWGDNNYGELGRTGSAGVPAPVTITDVVRVGAANQIGYAVKKDGTVWAWGRNDKGQLGDGTTTNRSVPVEVVGLTDIISVAGGDNLSYAVDSVGRLWRWGTVAGSATPTAPERVTGTCNIGNSVLGVGAANFEQCFDGTVWGLDYGGYVSTAQLPDLSDITAIAPGPGFFTPGVLAHKADGTVWRYNDDTGHYYQVPGLNGISAIGGGVGVYYAATS